MKTVLAVVIALFLAQGAAAEAPPKGGGACKADTEKFCAGVKPGDGRLAKCLKEHEAELSPECKASTAKRAAKPPVKPAK